MRTHDEQEAAPGLGWGLRRSVTIAIGYAPVAVTFGLLAARYGISFWQATLMSLLVYAGASQFIAIDMLHQGASVAMIAVTTLIVNIRHVLMSFALIPLFSRLPLHWSAALAQGLTDETFVLNAGLLKTIPDEASRRRAMLGVNLGAFAAWVVFTLLGALVGEWLPVDFSGFRFALLALFLVLTAATLRRRTCLTYVLAGIFAVVFKLLLPGKSYIILSVALAAGAGAWWRHRAQRVGKEAGA